MEIRCTHQPKNLGNFFTRSEKRWKMMIFWERKVLLCKRRSEAKSVLQKCFNFEWCLKPIRKSTIPKSGANEVSAASINHCADGQESLILEKVIINYFITKLKECNSIPSQQDALANILRSWLWFFPLNHFLLGWAEAFRLLLRSSHKSTNYLSAV